MSERQIFEKVEKPGDLEQGDLLLGLTLPILNIADVTSISSMRKTSDLVWSTGNFIVLTQSCDLDLHNDKQIDRIILAPVLTTDTLLKNNPYYRQSDRFKKIIKNKTSGFYCVPSPDDPSFNDELLIIITGSPEIAQLNLVRSSLTAESSIKQYHMASPYSESLSNSFAYQFERVPLPDRVFPPESLQSKALASRAALSDQTS